jgi:hypothetical protein
MKTLFRTFLFAFAAVFGVSASVANAGDLKLSIANGRVTLIAQDVPVRQILAEWARIGRTTIVNGEKVPGPSVTLQLVDQPERDALEILLKTAAGYVAAPRQVALADASVYDRIMILPTSRAPAYSASAPPPPQFSRPMPQPAPDEDDQPVVEVPPMTPPQVPPGMNYPAQNVPGQNVPGQNVPGQQPQQQPLTAPRPGMLPSTPGVQPPNPYGTPTLPPGVRPPGPGGPGRGPGGPGDGL